MSNAISMMSLLASGLETQAAGMDSGVAAFKKSNNAAKQQGEAMVEMIENATPPTDEHRLDVYA